MAHYSGAIFGSYEIVDLIARGGMGEVYRARHRRLQGREVAIKIMPAVLASDPSFLQRFEREANNVAALNHPNILPIWDYGEQDGAPYIVMPLVTGGSLRDQLHGRPVPPAALLRVLTPIASALDYAHQRGIIHRDIKPANVLLDANGHLYLADFGIAKAIGPSTENLTETGVGIGTPEYMAPEQTEGRADPRSDVYALGVIAYEGLSGHVPYSGNTPIDVAIKHLTAPLPPLALPAGAITPAVEDVVRRALEKSPEARYPTAGAFVADLAEALRRAEAGRPTTMVGPVAEAAQTSYFTPIPPTSAAGTPPAPAAAAPPTRSESRRGLLIAIAAVLTVILVVAGGATALLASRGKSQDAGLGGGSATATATLVIAATPNDIPYAFPVTNARIISDYRRAQQLLQRDAPDGRLHSIYIECFDPLANADCRLSYTFYSTQKNTSYAIAFSFYEAQPPESDGTPADDDTARTIFMQLPWERNPNWPQLLRESYQQLPANAAPNGFSIQLGVEAQDFNRGNEDWFARYTDKDSGQTADFKQRGQVVTKIE